MIIRSFKKEDILAIQNAVEPSYSCQANYDACDSIDSLSATMEEDGKPILCGGASLDNNDNDVCWIWCIVADPVKNKITLYRAMRASFEIIMSEIGRSRAKTLVVEGFEQGERLVRHMGFVRSGSSVKVNGINCLEYTWDRS